MVRKETTTCLFLPQKLSISLEATTWQSGTVCSSTTSLRHMFCRTAAERTASGSQVKQPSFSHHFHQTSESSPDCWLTSVTWKSLAILPPGPGTGVPFHWHGPGFAEVIYGKKVNGDVWVIRFTSQSLAWLKDHLLFIQRWFFYPPEREPHFDRNRTTLSWVTEVYPNLPEDEAPLECTLRPGEVTTHLLEHGYAGFYSEDTSATSEDRLWSGDGPVLSSSFLPKVLTRWGQMWRKWPISSRGNTNIANYKYDLDLSCILLDSNVLFSAVI